MNFKTTFFGVVSIVSGIVSIINGNTQEGATMIATGLGLMFAKDHNK